MKYIGLVLLTALLSGCASVGYHRDQVRDNSDDRVTVGTVQKEISIGMPSSDVAATLGSPNIVTTDENRREVWIYDKLSTENAYSTSSGGISTLILGFGGSVGGGLGVRPSVLVNTGEIRLNSQQYSGRGAIFRYSLLLVPAHIQKRVDLKRY